MLDTDKEYAQVLNMSNTKVHVQEASMEIETDRIHF